MVDKRTKRHIALSCTDVFIQNFDSTKKKTPNQNNCQKDIYLKTSGIKKGATQKSLKMGI